MRRGTFALVLLSAVTAGACAWIGGTEASPVPSADVFTPAHATLGAAAREFFSIRPAAQQPIEFPHDIHIQKGLTCTQYCHESATKGPVAGIPSVKTCMICHEAIATDRPLIQQVADYSKRKIEIPWQRVYGFTPQAHVHFQHAPHIRAEVDVVEVGSQQGTLRAPARLKRPGDAPCTGFASSGTGKANSRRRV